MYGWVALRKISLALFLLILAACASQKTPSLAKPAPKNIQIESPDAELYYSILRRDRPLEHLEKALKKDPSSIYILTKLASEYLRQNQLEKSAALAKKAETVCPNCREPQNILGRIYAAQLKFTESEKHFLKSMSLDEEDTGEDALYLNTLYSQQKQYDKGIQLLNTYIQRNPDRDAFYYYLGKTYAENNQIDLAEQTYRKGIQINPDFPHNYKALGLLYEYQGNLPEALNHYLKSMQIEPDNVELAKHISLIYLELKKFDEAKENLAQLSKLEPNDLEILVRLGLLYLRDGDYKKAEATFDDALKIEPALTQARYYLGIIFEHAKNFPKALKHLKIIQPSSNMYADSQQAIASIYEEQGKKKLARETITQALLTHDGDISLHIYRAKLFAKQGHADRAIELLEKQTSKHPKNEGLYFALGELYDQTGDFKRLNENFLKVIELNPENALALNYLGFAYAEKNFSLKEAENYVLRALKVKPDDGYIIDSLAWIYYKMDRYPEAADLLKKATALVPDEAVILEHLGDVLSKMNHHDEARKVYAEALKNSKEDVEKKRIGSKLKTLLVRS